MFDRIISCLKRNKEMSVVVLIYIVIVVLGLVYKPWVVIEDAETLDVMAELFLIRYDIKTPTPMSNPVLNMAVSTAFAGISDFVELMFYGILRAAKAAAENDAHMADMGKAFVFFCFFVFTLQRSIAKRITEKFRRYSKAKERIINFMVENIVLAISCYSAFHI